MNVYVMRHGTTVWNEKGITQGRTNNRLSVSGKELTEEVAKKYSETKFDIIFASPLMRTMQTANIINRYHKVKIIKDERLIEIDQGIFSGKSKYEITEEEKKLKFARAKECGMESYESVYKRIENFINELKKNKKYENVLIVTHNVGASFAELVLTNTKVDYNNDKHLRSFKNAEMKCFNI
jgi:probable phosphoglycerate mutase